METLVKAPWRETKLLSWRGTQREAFQITLIIRRTRARTSCVPAGQSRAPKPRVNKCRFHTPTFWYLSIHRLFPAKASVLGRAVYDSEGWKSLSELVKANVFTDVKGSMESALHQRDRIGVQDSVLLEDYESEDAFLENLRKRFKANLIYVSVLT